MDSVKPGARLLEKGWEIAIITVIMALMSAVVYFFLVPSNAAVNSVSGAAIIINGLTGLPISLIALIINAALIVLGFLLMGMGFAFNTIYSCVLLSVFLALLEGLFPDFTSFTGSAELDVACYVLLVSWLQAMIFRHNAASSGLGVIAQIMNRYLHMEVGRAMSIVGLAIALCSGLVYDGKTVALSVLGTYLNGLAMDHFVFGQNLKRRVSVITPRYEQLREYILNELHCGATIYRAEGAYTHGQFPELVVIVDKPQYQRLMSYVHKLDPDAFVAVYTVSEVSRKAW